MRGCIAIINAGSSSIKFALFATAQRFGEKLLYRGQIEQIGVAPRMRIADAEGITLAEEAWPAKDFDHKSGTRAMLQAALGLIGDLPVRAVGHRVVHGGMAYPAPVRVNPQVIAALRKLIPLAPLHQPHNLAPIEAIAEAAPHVPQVACFDTAFHRRQPPLAQMFALPRTFTDAGVRRYGFHGLSYEYIAGRLGELAPDLAAGRTIVCHLGNGASACALQAGRSIATTMGFTAVDGLMMGTRCGAIDPGVIVHLMDAYGMDARAIEDLIYKRSGLLGVSGLSSDMRTLQASDDPAAAEAVALFVYRVVREIGSLAAALGGVDGIVFTGGIGENDSRARADILAGCRWLGVEIDAQRNVQGLQRISTSASAVQAWVIPTDEEQMMVRHTVEVLGLSAATPQVPEPSA